MWTQSRVWGKNVATNDILTLDKVGKGSKKSFHSKDVVLIL